jgi:hypothetical protein
MLVPAGFPANQSINSRAWVLLAIACNTKAIRPLRSEKLKFVHDQICRRIRSPRMKSNKSGDRLSPQSWSWSWSHGRALRHERGQRERGRGGGGGARRSRTRGQAALPGMVHGARRAKQWQEGQTSSPVAGFYFTIDIYN